MPAAARNLLNLKEVEKGYGSRLVLRELTLGIAAGERIGLVGQNGGGKSTLLRLIAGLEQPDAGALTRSGDADVALLGQRDELDRKRTIREVLVGARADHEWAGDSAFRDVLDGLLGGVGLRLFAAGIDTPLAGLSGGERRRVALARLLLDPPELLLLDEPTNHLDVEGVDWLARHLAARRGSMLVVTHDRWFLDAVCTSTWELADGEVHQYDGGYAAYVLARAERDRQEGSRAGRRRQLLRKELAWLRRGPPARTSKPKFRIDAANALIADEPEVRDRAELLRFAASRLGNKVLDVVDVSLMLGARQVLNDLTWRLGPGDRVAIVGVNGSGKTSLVRLLSGELEPTSGRVERGATVRVAHLSQETAEIPGHLRVLESLEEVRGHATLSSGEEITAAMLCERFGFRGEKARTLVDDLSGGERRRLALMRLLMGEPNVLLLDEPTNDLDIDTLTALEDLLDGWPGTLVVVSHDRYFVERVCDDVYALTPDGGIRHLPGGIEQYIEQRRTVEQQSKRAPDESDSDGVPAGARLRAERKQTQRAERELKQMEGALERLVEREAALNEQMAAVATDHTRLAELQSEFGELLSAREQLETQWLQTSESLEG
ncbi:MAG TPA: ABC-F family ATP-binding cassette domain-containing protein [Solirubrobacteraceae bacterium]|jgi:ATP-binding cassette subfamily F protein uup|nr:ABC-F family ATP-binding cassette domain-containing protein [Solirubrobacteraceae bacterium]